MEQPALSKEALEQLIQLTRINERHKTMIERNPIAFTIVYVAEGYRKERAFRNTALPILQPLGEAYPAIKKQLDLYEKIYAMKQELVDSLSEDGRLRLMLLVRQS
jgi:hypothetical protein